MENKRGICLLNDSFPPSIDGVANAVSNYARIIDERYGSAMVMTPDYPGADDSVWKFPVLRYPSLDLRKQIGFMAGFPFSPELSLALKENKVELLHSHCPVVSTILARELKSTVDAPLVLTYHTKFDIDIARWIADELDMKFERTGERTRYISCSFRNFDKDKQLRAELDIFEPDMEEMFICTPWKEKATAFYYNCKKNCLSCKLMQVLLMKTNMNVAWIS